MIIELNEAGMSLVSGLSNKVDDELEIAWHMPGDEEAFKVLGIVRDVAGIRVGVEFRNLTVAERVRLSQSLPRAAAQ